MGTNTFYVIFQIDQQPFAIQLSRVIRISRIVQMTPIPEAPEIIKGVANVQGDIIPVVSLRKRFDLNCTQPDLDDQIIFIQSNNRVLGLLVDEVTDIIESPDEDIISQKNVIPGADRIQGLMKSKEQIILIQDVDRMISLDEERKLDRSLKKSLKTKK